MNELNPPEDQSNNNENGNKQSICEHGRQRSRCKDCGGSAFCEHGRIRRQCKDCGGSAFCEHGRIRRQCKECGGSAFCEHDRIRRQCKECGGSCSNTSNHDRKRKNDQSCSDEDDRKKRPKIIIDRLPQLRKEYAIRVVSNYSPSTALHIGKYFFNNK